MAAEMEFVQKGKTLTDLPKEILTSIQELVLSDHLILISQGESEKRPANGHKIAPNLYGDMSSRAQGGYAKGGTIISTDLRALVFGNVPRVNDRDKVAKHPALLSLALTCKSLTAIALKVLYSTNTFDLNLIIVSFKSMKEVLPWVPYPAMTSFTLPLSAVKMITSIHLSTLVLENTVMCLEAVPLPCLRNVKHLKFSCAYRTEIHIPCEETRSHIPTGRIWTRFWALVTEKFIYTSFPRVINIDVDICGWHVPLGWRKLTLEPIGNAADALKCLELSRSRYGTGMTNQLVKESMK